jgi:hypothetical protein
MLTYAVNHPDQEHRTAYATPEHPPSKSVKVHAHILFSILTRRKKAPTDATSGTKIAPYPIK